MGLIIGGVSASDLILDGQSVSLYVGGNPPTKVWPTRDTVQITLGTDLEARDQFRAALADRGLNYQTVTEIPFDIEFVGTGSARDLFRLCSSLTSVPDMDTSGVTNMRSMFNGCSSLTSVPDMDTSGVTNMGWMFQDCSSLTTVPWMDTSNVTHMNSMFRACASLTSVSDLDTIGVTDTSYMFYGCAALTDGNVLLIGKHPQVDTTSMILGSGLTREPFDTVQITLGTDLEARDQLQAALSARGLDYRTVTKIPFIIELVGSGSARAMFQGCAALTHAPDMDTSQVTSMRATFSGCSSLTYVPEMDTSQVTNMSAMFYGCSVLTHVPDLNAARVTTTGTMFYNCASLTDGNVRLIGRHPNVSTTSMITGSGLTKEPFIELVQVTLGSGMDAQMDFRNALSARGLSYRNVTELPFVIELVGTGAADSLFDGCQALTSVPAMDTSQVTSMERMFYNCKALTTVPAMNTSQVTSMNSMFRGCSSLTYVPDMYTSQVTDAWYMFRDCSVLTDENVRLIGKNPIAETTGMIQNSGLTREPFYATSRLPNPPAPRVVTIRQPTNTYGRWDKNTVTGDASLIQEWVGNDVVRFVAYVTCSESVYISGSYTMQEPGAVLPSGADVKPAMRDVYTFTEVI